MGKENKRAAHDPHLVLDGQGGMEPFDHEKHGYTFPLPDPNERGVIRFSKENGPRRLTVLGTQEHFEVKPDEPTPK